MKLVNAVIIVFLLFSLVFSARGCHDEIKTPIDTMQVNKYKAEIDSLKKDYLKLLNNRAVKIKTLRIFRQKHIHDTINLQSYIEDTAKIRSLIDENRMLTEIIYEDSLVIANQGQIITFQDSAILNLEAITATQRQLMDGCINEVKKQRRKASFWRSVAIALGIVVIAK